MRLAARGLRDLDSGEEAVTDKAEREQLRRQARKVTIEAVVMAALVTAALLAV